MRTFGLSQETAKPRSAHGLCIPGGKVCRKADCKLGFVRASKVTDRIFQVTRITLQVHERVVGFHQLLLLFQLPCTLSNIVEGLPGGRLRVMTARPARSLS